MKHLIILGVLVTGTAMASTLAFESNSTANDPDQWNSMGSNILIPPNPIWATNLGPWISFIDSGAGGVVLPNAPPGMSPTATFYDEIDILGVPTYGTISVAADDTTSIYVNGDLVSTGSQVQLTYCSAVNGCLLSSEGTYNITPYLIQGDNVISFGVRQQDAETFGLSFAGGVSYNGPISPPPSPAAELNPLIMIGIALPLLFVGKRRLRASRV